MAVVLVLKKLQLQGREPERCRLSHPRIVLAGLLECNDQYRKKDHQHTAFWDG